MIRRLAVLATCFCVGLTGCGHKKKDNKSSPTPNSRGHADDGAAEGDASVGLRDVVKGRWALMVRAGGEAEFTAVKAQPINVAIAAKTQFDISNSNFKTPDPTGLASFGTLDITALLDNNLTVCGASGTSRCTKAIIRIYTSGTPGPGLWNAVSGYGLPISSGATAIGLDVAGAHVVSSAAISANTRVLNLKSFNINGNLQIPIAVDFSDAEAGSYSSTLNIEYVLQ